ncbi:hypothetical protein [Streptomyces sp. NPDC059994]|uniref:hypothetical protein n=1 Tax=Streptomyces sp. NPDC059994 TaxID=3347029 RepID=UPI00368892CC
MNTPDYPRAESPVHEATELAWEAATARIQDANLARLRQEDPDADRLFPPGPAFTEALTDQGVMHRLGAALEAYGAAKHTADRMDLFQRLFADTTSDGTLHAG